MPTVPIDPNPPPYWKFTGSSGVCTAASGFKPPAPASGSQVVFLQTTGAIEQTFLAPINGTYTVTFSSAARVGYDTHDFDVMIDGTAIGRVVNAPADAKAFRPLSFTADLKAGPRVLKFAGVNSKGGDHTSFIDAIGITAPTPPPPPPPPAPVAPIVTLADPSFEDAILPTSGLQYRPLPVAPVNTEMGIGVSPIIYYQADAKMANLFDPLVMARPTATDGATYGPDGWPTSLPAGKTTGWYIPATEGYTRPGKYRLTARGSGSVYYNHPDLAEDKRNVSVRGTGDADAVLAEFDVKTTARTLFQVKTTDPSNPLRAIRLYRVDDDPAVPFSGPYLADCRKFKVLRTAGYTGVINSPDVDMTPWRSAQWAAAFDLCSRTGCDAWINIPHKASEAYVREVARIAKARLTPGLKVYCEYSIEIWNWGYPFNVGTQYVTDWTKANLDPTMGAGQPYQFGHAELAHRAHEAFASEAPDIPLVRLACHQHANTWLASQFFSYADPRGYKFDAIATAPYCEPVGQDAAFWAKVDPLWAGDAASKDQAIQAVMDSFDRGIAVLEANARAYKAMAIAHNARLVTYEAAPGMQLPNTWPQGRLDLLQAVHRDPRMGTFLTGRYFPWLARYFDLIMYTQDCDRPSPGKFWAAKANADDNDCPKWLACMDWCAGHNAK